MGVVSRLVLPDVLHEQIPKMNGPFGKSCFRAKRQAYPKHDVSFLKGKESIGKQIRNMQMYTRLPCKVSQPGLEQ